MRERLRIVAAVAFAATVVTASTVAAQDSLRTLGPVTRFPEPFSIVTGVRVLSSGEILVADRIEKSVVRLDRTLQRAVRIGRDGSGPGEYAAPAGLVALPGDSTLLVDPGLMRLTAYDREGRAGASMPMLEGYSLLWPTQSAGQHLYWHNPDAAQATRGGKVQLQRLDRASGRRDVAATMDVPPQLWPENARQGWGAPTVAFFTRDAYAVAPDGRVAIVRYSPYRVDWVEREGRIRRGAARTVAPIPVTQADKEEWAARIARARPQMRGDDGRVAQMPGFQADLSRTVFPTHYPPFLDDAASVAPDGTVWVQRAIPSRLRRVEYDLFDADGAWRATVRLAVGQKVVGFRGAEVVLVTRDDDGLEWLEVAALQSRGGRAGIGGSGAEDGEALLRRINAAHRSDWFRSLVFVQRTTFPGTTRPEETWYETMLRPGFLRIDVEREGAMVQRTLFRNDSLYQWNGAEQVASRPLLHPLLLLLHDLHVGDADTVIRKLRTIGFDLATTSAATWEGRPVIVVGATAGDTTTRQFWVDAERLVVVRTLQRGANGALSDVRIGRYSTEGAALVEREITFHTNGRPTMVEEYTWVRTGVAIPAEVFLPGSSELPSWIAEYKRTRQP
jgi:hypothetical protein